MSSFMNPDPPQAGAVARTASSSRPTTAAARLAGVADSTRNGGTAVALVVDMLTPGAPCGGGKEPARWKGKDGEEGGVPGQRLVGGVARVAAGLAPPQGHAPDEGAPQR